MSDPSPLHAACSTSGPPPPPPPLAPHPPSCLTSPQLVTQQRMPSGKEEPAKASGMGLMVWEKGTAEPASAGMFPLKEGCWMTQITASETAWGAGVQDRCSQPDGQVLPAHRAVGEAGDMMGCEDRESGGVGAIRTGFWG